ncbi:MAG: hypothetical protein MRZ28_08070, partial [Oscillospiraceae bacterium]|nr:hypothetical protein [Oscillospiraceae bacterium]MDY3219543.1 hypothetical protein [Candidatus Fimivivens sp.]
SRFPVPSGGSSGLIRSYCSFVNSYRFMLIASHHLVSCATFIFQTRPRLLWQMFPNCGRFYMLPV